MSLFRSGVVVIRFKSLQAAPLHSKGHWTDKNSYIKVTKTAQILIRLNVYKTLFPVVVVAAARGRAVDGVCGEVAIEHRRPGRAKLRLRHFLVLCKRSKSSGIIHIE